MFDESERRRRLRAVSGGGFSDEIAIGFETRGDQIGGDELADFIDVAGVFPVWRIGEDDVVCGGIPLQKDIDGAGNHPAA